MTKRMLAVGAVAVLIALGWLVWQARVRPVAGVRSGAVVSPAAARSLPARAAPAAASSVVRNAPDDVEVCDGPRVPRRADGTLDPARYAAAIKIQGLVDRVVAAWHRDGSDRTQAAIALIGTAPIDDARVAGDASLQALHDALAGAALSTADADVYALAYGICSRVGSHDEGLCPMLSARRWAELDPDNLTPWLAVAAEAAQEDDAAAEDDAMRHAAQASASRLGTEWVVPLVLAQIPDDEASALAGFDLAVAMIGVDAALPVEGYAEASRYCGVDRLADPGRRQACEGIARRWVQRPDSLLGKWAGTRIGERLGWPADTVALSRGEMHAYEEARADRSRDVVVGGPYDCATAKRRLAAVKALDRSDEAARMAAWIAASGKSREDFIRIGRALARPR